MTIRGWSKSTGGGPEEMQTRFLKKNMTHPLAIVVAQNFGDPPPPLG